MSVRRMCVHLCTSLSPAVLRLRRCPGFLELCAGAGPLRSCARAWLLPGARGLPAAGTAPVAPALAGRFLTPEPAGVSLRTRVLLWRVPSVDVRYVRLTVEPSSPTSFLVSACRVSSLTGVWKSPAITMDHLCLFCSCLKIHFI